MENPDDESAKSMLEYYLDFEAKEIEKENDPEWRKNNMEYDLRTSKVIVDKVRSDEVYAQHLYAAMCNNEFQQNDVWPILSGETWSCSWRYAGGIVSNIVGKGDYIDWYCSGIRNGDDLTDEQFNQLNYEERESYIQAKRYVSESVITDEIRQDLFDIGWKPVAGTDNF